MSKSWRYKRGEEFAFVGKGKSGPHQKDRKGFNNKKDRKSSKQELRDYLR